MGQIVWAIFQATSLPVSGKEFPAPGAEILCIFDGQIG